jgi:hypothetical protein
LTEQSPHPEWFAVKEPFSLNRHVCLHAGRDQATVARSKIDARKRLIDLKRSRLSGLCVDMSPIVETECHVAVLLNLEDNNITAQSVNRSRGNEYSIAWFRDNSH